MSAKQAKGSKRRTKNVDVRHQLGMVAFGLFAVVILLMVFFPQLRPGGESEEEAPIPAQATQSMLILAASSLSDPLSQAARAYEETHPDWKLELSFAASNTLRRQIERGAPADLFLSANHLEVEALQDEGWIPADAVYSMWTTGLVVIAPADAAAPLDAATALRQAERIAIGDRGVPVGEYARDALESLGLMDATKDRLVPLPNELAVVQAVATGACDRGVVYAASVHAGRNGERVQAIAVIPAESHQDVVYFAAIPGKSPHAVATLSFVLYLTQGDGAIIFQEAGLQAPTAPMH